MPSPGPAPVDSLYAQEPVGVGPRDKPADLEVFRSERRLLPAQPLPGGGVGGAVEAPSDYTQGEWLPEAPNVQPSAKRLSANGLSSGTSSPMRSFATSRPTPVILNPWFESAIM
jgi:hypothetical protein